MLRVSYKSILFRKAFRFKACLGKPIIPAPGDKDYIDSPNASGKPFSISRNKN